MRGATWIVAACARMPGISIHAPHARSDEVRAAVRRFGKFQSTLLMRGATRWQSSCRWLLHFNPRSSCEERRLFPACLYVAYTFQSTLLMRGATQKAPARCRNHHFNPRSSCEERPHDVAILSQSDTISIHAPHARSDVRAVEHVIVLERISIHAPHARSDDRPCRQRWRLAHFNPRSSCEERLSPSSSSTANISFQSTLLMRGATRHTAFVNLFKVISIHAPHARSDGSLGRRRRCNRISIHAPHARSDADTREQFRHDNISIHAPHARSDMPFALSDSPFSLFQSTLLMRGATSAAIRARTSRAHFNPRSSCEERRHASKQT